MNSYNPYSFSKISTYVSCNRKFKYSYIDKIKIEEKPSIALLKGRAIHSILEHYPYKSTNSLASKYQDLTNKFINSEYGKKYLSNDNFCIKEYKFGLDYLFEPSDYYDKNTLFRGCVDFIGRINNELYLCDWKSGKYVELRFQNFNQLLFYSIYFFQKYDNIESINLSYVYVEHNLENTLIVRREYLDNYTSELSNLIHEIESDTTFKKNKTKLCDYCVYQECCNLM